MVDLGEFIQKAERITEIREALNFIDNLPLGIDEKRQVILVRCKTIGDCLEAYKRYGQNVLSEEHRKNLVAAALSEYGCFG
jgi:hypothetical protein